MSESPCTDALIEFKKSVRDRWSGAIEAEINRAFHHGYASGELSRTPPPATAKLLEWLREHPNDYGIQACQFGLLKCLGDFLSEQS